MSRRETTNVRYTEKRGVAREIRHLHGVINVTVIFEV